MFWLFFFFFTIYASARLQVPLCAARPSLVFYTCVPTSRGGSGVERTGNLSVLKISKMSDKNLSDCSNIPGSIVQTTETHFHDLNFSWHKESSFLYIFRSRYPIRFNKCNRPEPSVEVTLPTHRTYPSTSVNYWPKFFTVSKLIIMNYLFQKLLQ